MVSTRVLLVEDDAFLKQIYEDTLTQEGFGVITASDGNEALQKLQSNEWDILLMDIILPHLDGIEVLRKLKNDPTHSHLISKPIIFLTNLDNENEKKQALELGQGYLVKSQITPGELVNEIKSILQDTSL